MIFNQSMADRVPDDFKGVNRRRRNRGGPAYIGKYVTGETYENRYSADHRHINPAALSPVFAQNRGVTGSTLAVRAARLSVKEIWVDNWFAMSVDGAPLYEDSTATTPSGRLTGSGSRSTLDLHR
jgi:hypothetical protein